MADLFEARPARSLGPGDHGLALELEELEAAELEPGFRYDLVDGKLEVSPEPDLPHDEPLDALDALLREYRAQHPGAFDHLSLHSRVFPRGRQTIGPDLALFRGHRPFTDQRWQDLSPVLVVEVLSPGQEDKDLVRNRRVYAEIESIREYWIVDPRRGWSRLTFRALRRDDAGGWTDQVLVQGARYETPLFPGLVLDLSRPDLGRSQLEAVRLDLAKEQGRAQGRIELVSTLLQTRLPEAADRFIPRLSGCPAETLLGAAQLLVRTELSIMELEAQLDQFLPRG